MSQKVSSWWLEKELVLSSGVVLDGYNKNRLFMDTLAVHILTQLLNVATSLIFKDLTFPLP